MQVSSFELEKIRTVKAAMNRLQTRIARVKQELETILDDNQEMMVSKCGTCHSECGSHCWSI